MPDPNSNEITSIRQVVENADWVTNWVTALVVSGGLSLLIGTVKDKLTFTAIATSFITATFMTAAGYPVLVSYGYGGLVSTMVLAVMTGAGGIVILLTFVTVIRKFIQTDAKRMAERALGNMEK